MKVTLLSKYSRMGASSRLRSMQYLPALKEAGFCIDTVPLFDDDYLTRLYNGSGRSLSSVARCYMKRTKSLSRLQYSDLIWLEKEALPYIPYWLEKGLMPKNVPYVVDYDDAVFHNYDLSSKKWVRRILGNKIDWVMANAAVVICGNDYLAERANQAGAKNIEQIPTVVDPSRYQAAYAVGREKDQPIVIGWIGSPSTQHYVLELKSVLESLHAGYGIRLVLVGAHQSLEKQFGTLPVEVLTWSEKSEAKAIELFDIGIMPLTDGPWERGKCGYKLIQYMACGKPVIASPVGVNVEIVENWQCGLLANSPDQWYDAINDLLKNSHKRQKLGLRGRSAVEQYYSMSAQAPRLARILHQAAAKD